MNKRMEIPFESIENAHEYIRLLAETVAASKHDIATLSTNGMSDRRIEALHVVEYNLGKLQRYLAMSGRTLNDLRSLRRLLFDERASAKDTKALPASQSLAPLAATILVSEPVRAKKLHAVVASKA